ncbi:MAG: ROK family protein [Bryobacterales bacterium]|nr:ROK family protein [Bryobacterales bacterium]MBV9398592.1 ROK family protein [Bryobacterales bacterium]
MAVLGVDIGGTKIAAGRVNARAEVEGFRSIPTLASRGFEVSLGQIWRAVESSLTPQVQAIGICAPGPLDVKTGVVLNPPNLPGWHNVPLAKFAKDKFGLPVVIENDCNAAGLAEALHGAGRGYSHVFYAAIGTGIGSGIVLDGKIFHGAHGAGAEAGHMCIDYRSSILCGCGTAGCIEALASGRVFDDAADEDLDELAGRLGAWLGAVISLLDPGIIVLGGGVAQMGEPLFGRLRAAAPRWTVNPYSREIPIVPAQFGAESGVIGAAAVVIGAQ